MDDRFGIISQVDMVGSRELANDFKVVRVALMMSSCELSGGNGRCLCLEPVSFCDTLPSRGKSGHAHPSFILW